MKIKSLLSLLFIVAISSNIFANEKEEKALLSAAYSGDIGQIEYLIQKGISPNIVDTEGNTPLHYAASQNRDDAIHLLIKHGAKLDVQNSSENSPLSIAATQNHFESVDVLLTAGANPNLQRSDNTSVLHSAASKGNFRSLVSLIVFGADVNKESSTGVTPLMLAAGQANMDIAKVLLENGAVNSVDKNGNDVLTWARESNNSEMIDLILSYTSISQAK
ncbi:MAG: ankyrin repeat domain-containing protein [Balneolaceae bacterium]